MSQAKDAANDSACENCDGFTQRQCPRCGQRICRTCATDHNVMDYGNYLGDASRAVRPCTRQNVKVSERR